MASIKILNGWLTVERYELSKASWSCWNVHLDDIVSMRAAFKTLQPRCHLTADHDGGGSRGVEGLAHGGVEGVKVLTLALPNLEALTPKSFGDRETW